ncbi:hypothetical protein VP01_6364g1 [Puccinia sorghi]|uniref:Uncharacterized protein n=1 Tax=Puccinia sorghi TaxID=27349 RepID=A0A0L6UG21_9BASI|nr:hypothetical protein VP01_6364g1 [Puccinia sorghi]
MIYGTSLEVLQMVPWSQSGSGLEEHLTALFNPTVRKKCDNENRMTKFCAMQLRDVNKTVNKLRDKVNCLQTSDQRKVTLIQEKLTSENRESSPQEQG